MPNNFRIEHREGSRPDIVIVKPEGALTVETVPAFQPVLRNAAVPLVIMDLAAVPHIDSAGLGALLIFMVSQQKAGRRFVLAAVPERVRVLLELTKVTSVLHAFPTVEAAEQS